MLKIVISLCIVCIMVSVAIDDETVFLGATQRAERTIPLYSDELNTFIDPYANSLTADVLEHRLIKGMEVIAAYKKATDEIIVQLKDDSTKTTKAPCVNFDDIDSNLTKARDETFTVDVPKIKKSKLQVMQDIVAEAKKKLDDEKPKISPCDSSSTDRNYVNSINCIGTLITRLVIGTQHAKLNVVKQIAKLRSHENQPDYTDLRRVKTSFESKAKDLKIPDSCPAESGK